ncbi:DNA polymerase III subunit gamma and tau [Arachnia propionica]|uniref:DNA polymerase III subunit gamma and tau n=1 Tax=Arachnia propionica TaxID=1750 RepID=UPI000F716DB8|nr:DNA polymerase III subunit tau [Arachnia propionica]
MVDGKVSATSNTVERVEDEYDGEPEDEYAPLDEGYLDEPAFEQEGPGLFDEPGDEEPVAPASAAPSHPVADDRRARSEAAPPPLALYRRYRPDSFAEVIGQDHVTVPLMRALDNNRVNHAYLFSGPRGCGKTTSARILARCLNCEQGPTSTPCGVCRSCQDLARGGPGSIDVIEIDAASHGGVEDARDLRERAFFAPVHSRYKIYIVDEAHMVTTAGFNALLKLVEEPPPHAKFVFATTEPEKVIGTIRSRTHHYPFRLVPPRLLGEYLAGICATEGVVVEPSALPLVVRAGGGSVRDSLSVLDQLLGGAGPEGVSHDQAAALLGFTPDALLDEIVDAFAAGDAAGVFRSIDKIIEIGQDPRRFAEDLLRRLRDLVILAAVPQAAENGMLEVSADQAQRLATQVAGMGAGELTRAAEVIADGLTAMRGTTAPRLHLELMCARVLLPGADTDERGLHARMDRLERRVGMIGDGAPAPAPQEQRPRQAPPQQDRQMSSRQPAPDPRPEQPPRPEQRTPRPEPAAPHQQQRSQPEPAQPPRQSRPARPQRRPAGAPPAGAQAPAPQRPPQPAPEAGRPPQGGRTLTTPELRQVWPSVLEDVKRRRRFAHMMLSKHAQVLDVTDGQLLLGFSDAGARENFSSSGVVDLLIQAIIAVIGVEVRVQAVMSGTNERPAQPEQQAAPPHPERGERRQEPPPEPRQPRRRPEPTPPTPPEPDPEPEIAEDDQSLENADELAAKLLAEELGAEIIPDESLG